MVEINDTPLSDEIYGRPLFTHSWAALLRLMRLGLCGEIPREIELILIIVCSDRYWQLLLG